MPGRPMPEDHQVATNVMWIALFGNGSPGICEDMKEVKTAIIGDTEHDGMVTVQRQQNERLKALEERPRSRRLQVKDFISLSVSFLAIATFVLRLVGVI